MTQRILFAGQVGESLPPLYAGVPKRALMLAKIWREKGAEVGICFTYHHDHEDDLGASAEYFFEYPRKPGTKDKFTSLIRRAIRHPFLYLSLLFEALGAFRFLNKDIILYAAYGVFLDGVAASFNPTVIIAESGMHRSFFAALVAKRRRIAFILETYAEVHDPTVMYLGSDENRARFWTEFLAMPECIIAPSDYCGQGPRRYAPPGKVRMVFATTLEVGKFTADTRTKEEARSHFKVPRELFITAAVGSYSPRKGHDHLIEASAKLAKEGVPVGVVLCGEGDPTWLKKLAGDLGIADRVFFFQNLSEDDLRLLYKSADLYCDASNTPRACLGIALTEALATKLPAIAYDAGGLPEVVEEGKSGYLVPLNDIDALAESIRKVQTLSPAEREHIGAEGLARAKAVFDLPGIADELFEEIGKATAHA